MCGCEQTVAREYIKAYRSAHGAEPTCEPLGNGRFRIVSKSGCFDRYTSLDVRNLTRALSKLAKLN